MLYIVKPIVQIFFYYIGGSLWTSLKSKYYIRRLLSKLNPQIQKGQTNQPPGEQGGQGGHIQKEVETGSNQQCLHKTKTAMFIAKLKEKCCLNK
jgi:hypothetical protein